MRETQCSKSVALLTVFSVLFGRSSTLPYNGTACTVDVCKINDHSLRFFQIGDWGGQDIPPFVTPGQVSVARTMNEMGDDERVHFVMSVGDHFYTNGPKYANDSRFKTTFDDVYTFGKSDHVPWYLTAGNHDYYGDVRSQLEYAHLNPRWIYPSLSFVVHYELVPSSIKVDFILFDTVILCGETWGGGVDPQTGRYQKPYELPKGPKDPMKAEALWTWIQQRLEESKADYLFAVSHYPMFTGGRHGDFTCPGIRLLSLLDHYNVTAYLTAHDHNLQYLKSVSNSGHVLHHVISGGGNSLDKARRQLTPNGVNVTVLFFYPKPEEHHFPNTDNVGGFVYAEIGERNGSLWWYSGDGKELYHVPFQPRQYGHDSRNTPLRYHNIADGYTVSRFFFFSAALFSIWYDSVIF